MNKILVPIVMLAVVALPAGAAAKPNDSAKKAAIAQCKDERGKTRATREAFKTKYHSFSRCVRQNTAEEKAEEEKAHSNAAKECKAERKADPDAFREQYGTNGNGANAFGKCVSSKAKAKKAEMDAKDEEEVEDFKNAAKECASERQAMGREAFAEEYGTNRNNRNAFGKCVSGKTNEKRS
jgi:hypothetical protein